MTPPAMNQNASHNPMRRAFDLGRIERPEQICSMTFDEQRELPMRMQLGFDLTALD